MADPSRRPPRTLADPGTPPVRLPVACEGLQVNCCRNPDCENYGKRDPEGQSMLSAKEKRHAHTYLRYRLNATRPSLSQAGKAFFHCKGCKEAIPMKSNVGILEEYQRIAGSPSPPAPASCPEKTCENNQRPVSEYPKAYRKYGYLPLPMPTTSPRKGPLRGTPLRGNPLRGNPQRGNPQRGNPRRQCKECGTVFTLSIHPDHRKLPSLGAQDVLLLKLLVGKMPLRRIWATMEIAPIAFYTRLERFAEHFNALTREREANLPEAVADRRLEIGVDRQTYTLNWKDKQDKRNVRLLGIVAADNGSGYVFGPHLNFDPEVDAQEVEASAIEAGDYRLAEPYRRYARFWIQPDYRLGDLYADYKQAKRLTGKAGAGARQSVQQRYQEALARLDIEEGEAPDSGRPHQGMLVHSSYTLHAHFLRLRTLLDAAREVGIYMDQDSGMRGACLGAWRERIQAGRTYACYLRYNKHLTVDEKKARTQGYMPAKFQMAEGGTQTVVTPQWQALRERMKAAIHQGEPRGPWRDRWVRHPHTSMFEPEKELAMLTPWPENLDEDALADRYLSGSLHAVSRFCMQVRRMLSLFERPIRGSGVYQENRHLYSGYAPYNPKVATQVLEVFRGYYNYCKPGADGLTPAMRLGLAERVYSLEEVLGATEDTLAAPAKEYEEEPPQEEEHVSSGPGMM